MVSKVILAYLDGCWSGFLLVGCQLGGPTSLGMGKQ